MTAPLGMIAGSGDFPVDLARRAVSDGRPIFVVRLRGLASRELDALPGVTMPVGRFGGIVASLKRAGCRETLFAGKVMRPRLLEFRPDWLTLRALALMLSGTWRRDDALLRVIAGVFETQGISIVGPAQIWPDMLAPLGLLGATAPAQQDLDDIRAATRAALRVGAEDKGQGAIARAGAIIGVEDRGHTEALIERAAAATGQGGVLVKLCKPQQDRRLDLPVIGPQTVASAARARLAGIAIEAGGTIIARREETIRAADAAGLFLLGIDAKTGAS
ncbi:MAG: UDP-2,3-diacylglucosamine diphosphatase LpxI [Alphaproteobacteria bacterium]|nr:UDP-2,3-diacylglucosamine diphosphatase LpxI [Alphaproteobacteria bacterium]